jgi:heat-inducible transcriptional repressor
VVLLVLVLHDGTIKQQSLTTEQPNSQEELSNLAQYFNQRLEGVTLDQLESRAVAPDDPPLTPFARLVLDVIGRAMRHLEGQINEALHHDGLLEMLGQPEFAQIDRVRQLLQILEQGVGIGSLIPQALNSEGVQVVIGGEHGQDTMREYSVILSRYGRSGEVAGVLGLIGPTRMPYPRSISSVRYISSVMSDLLAELYGERSSSA